LKKLKKVLIFKNMKILIIIKNEIEKEIYTNIFREEKNDLIEASNQEEALNLAKNNQPDIIIISLSSPEIDGFKLLEDLKKNNTTQKIPVILLSPFENENNRKKAIQLEARDFIVLTKVSPRDLVFRVKSILGEEKTYQINIKEEIGDIMELNKDLGFKGIFKCQKCDSLLQLYLIRDLSKGGDYFKISFVCPKCSK